MPVDAILGALWVFGMAGLAVAVVFLLVGIDRVDEAARGSYAVRPILAPGVILLWPLVLWRWIARERARRADP